MRWLLACALIVGCTPAAASAPPPRTSNANTPSATRQPEIGTPFVSTPEPVTLTSVVVAGGAARVGQSIHFRLAAYDQNGQPLPAGSFTTAWSSPSGAPCWPGIIPELMQPDSAVFKAGFVGTCTAIARVTAFGRTVVGTGTGTITR